MDVKIVHLEPLRVASALGYGASPEMLAWDKLLAWAKANRQLEQPHRFFGFNNPSPTPASPNYGYEVWMTVSPDVQSNEMVTVKAFEGGDYAVTRCTGVEHIPQAWMELSTWAETSPYRIGSHQWLEEHIKVGRDIPESDFVLDLYLPIKA
jgi:DNA gyrase inhibitor GyrI